MTSMGQEVGMVGTWGYDHGDTLQTYHSDKQKWVYKIQILGFDPQVFSWGYYYNTVICYLVFLPQKRPDQLWSHPIRQQQQFHRDGYQLSPNGGLIHPLFCWVRWVPWVPHQKLRPFHHQVVASHGRRTASHDLSRVNLASKNQLGLGIYSWTVLAPHSQIWRRRLKTTRLACSFINRSMNCPNMLQHVSLATVTYSIAWARNQTLHNVIDQFDIV